MARSLVALGALLIVLAGAPAATATISPTAGLDPTGHEARIIVKIRAARGDAIVRDWSLMVAADRRAHQIAYNYCHCQPPQVAPPWGEILSWSWASWPHWESFMVIGWLNSPSHRAILLSRYYNRVGIGSAYRNGRWYVAVVFARR